MKMYLMLLAVLILSVSRSFAGFDDYFLNKTLRIDYYHTGNDSIDIYSLDELISEPYWGGSKVNLVDIFDYGEYKFLVYDDATNTLIYSRGYSTLFSEWQTTAEAKITTKSFSESVVMPFPKKKIRVEFYTRNRKGIFNKKFTYKVDPTNYFIKTERKYKYPTYDILNSGDPAVKVDIVIIPEGYTQDQMEQFKLDCKTFTDGFFKNKPYQENKEKFNVRCVLAPSQESGTDVPADKIWKNTLVNTNFYTFGTERYLMTMDDKMVRNVAANAPYDQIYILVNTDIYGGGAIYNYYAVCVSTNQYKDYIFAHEFGHAFAGLADEYYDSDVSYNDFYPKGVEPWEPNITTLVAFDKKWKDLVDKTTPIPTPFKEEYMKTVGAFEGGGYVAKGVYRPSYDCTMKSISVNNFCKVCTRSIEKMIKFYSE